MADPTTPAVETARRRDFRLGLWTVYQTAGPAEGILPDDGVGVFLFNLIRGLLQVEDAPRIVLMVHYTTRKAYRDAFRDAGPRLEIVSPPPRLAERVLRALVRGYDRLGGHLRRLAPLRARAAGHLRACAARLLGPVLTKAGRKHVPSLLLLAAIGPPLALAAWFAFALVQAGRAAYRSAAAPFRLAYRVAVRLLARGIAPIDWDAAARGADCDVWVAPLLYCNHPANLPCSVFFIHDLVTHHFPEMFDREVALRAATTARRRAAEATFVACMSAATRDVDLRGVLGLPPEKIRMVETAIPLDFPPVSAEEAGALLPRRLTRPYLFYPTAFRPYKNHAGLVRALRVLRDEFGVEDFDLVFTGNIQTPEELARLISAFGLEGRVHAVGRVSREELAALYRCSYATVVSSLFEQGSYQIAEALHFESPVACSDIRPFRDQCAAMGDAMNYFDPHDPRSIAEAVLAIRRDREGVRLRQKAAARPILSRSWDEVARGWLAVFREAHRVASAGLPPGTRGAA